VNEALNRNQRAAENLRKLIFLYSGENPTEAASANMTSMLKRNIQSYSWEITILCSVQKEYLMKIETYGPEGER
jgi:hypothetical protein